VFLEFFFPIRIRESVIRIRGSVTWVLDPGGQLMPDPNPSRAFFAHLQKKYWAFKVQTVLCSKFIFFGVVGLSVLG
jgi:hypothetical protein